MKGISWKRDQITAICKIYLKPILTYNDKSWTFTKRYISNISKIQASDVNSLEEELRAKQGQN
jgi:hypothetical protein